MKRRIAHSHNPKVVGLLTHCLGVALALGLRVESALVETVRRRAGSHDLDRAPARER